MNFLLQFHIFFVISFLAAGLTAVLALFTWQQRRAQGASAFALLMGSISIWTLAIGGGMLTDTVQANFIWAVVRMAMVFAVPVLWLAFALQFCDRTRWLTLPNVVLVSIIPLVSLLLMATTGKHQLFLTGIDYVKLGPYLIDQTWHLGPWFWVHLIYSYALILLGDYLLVRQAFRVASQYRRQAVALLIGTLFPLLTNITYTFHLLPGLIVNYDPFGFVLAGLVFSLGLFHYQLFDLKPVARQLLIDSMGDGMLVVDEKCRIVDLNPAAQRIFAPAQDSLVGQSVERLLASYGGMKTMLANDGLNQHELCFENEGQRQVYDLRCSPIFSKSRNAGYLLVLREITRRKQLEEELQEMAITDPLTGLYNRRYFKDLTAHEYERAKRYRHDFALLMVDIDDFKQVNDRFGHPVGDLLLQALAHTCTQILRKTDIFFRYGGDEFAVLMPETGLEEAVQISTRMQRAVAALSVEILQGPVSLTISQGLALYQGYAEGSLEDLVADADRALYVAKNQGKNHLSIAGMN